MPSKIVLLGKEEKYFQFIHNALNNQDCDFEFVNVAVLEDSASQLADADLIIIDTLPYEESQFKQFYLLRENPQFSHIPTLALVKDKPTRLRYRLINMGINDYLTVPFHRLDLQVRCRNLMQSSSFFESSDDFFFPSQMPALHSLQTLNQLYSKMNQSIFQLDRDSFTGEILTAIHKLSKAHYTLLFEVVEDQHAHLRSFLPDGIFEDDWQLDTEDIPLLHKAIKLHQPTILNRVSTENTFITHLSAFLNIKVRSFIIYPVVIQNHTRFLICVLKSDQEKFSEFHYLLIQNFSHFLIHTYILSYLRKETQVQDDNQVWQFYFEYLDQVVNQLSFGILVISKDLKIKYLNENAAALLDVPHKTALHQPLAEILSERAIEKIMQAVNNSPFTVERPELQLSGKNGKKHLVGFSVQEFTDQMNGEEGYIVSLKDITFSKEIQEEMRRVDRLASLGVMASGIAHEIRNPLAGIKSLAQTFEEELLPEDPKTEYVQRIIRLVNRLDALLRTLFHYAKPPKPNRQPCALEEVLSEVIGLMRQNFRDHNIKLTELIHPNLPRALVDPAQIQQVLVNLFLNSIEAISKAGEIIISVQPISSASASSKALISPYIALGKAADYIEVQIKDNGCGISMDNLKHIFNPFFTTKTLGTGLGLSIVYQIVKENDGLINYESEIDKGTTCFLFLPAEKTPQNK